MGSRCAFTGHRPQKFLWRYDESADACIRLKALLSRQIEELLLSGTTDFLSGMAEGVDTWSAMAVLAWREKLPKVKLHCILPCLTQADQWSRDSRKTYYSILEQADSVVYVNRLYHKNCMLERNRFLVNHADILLAVYNGEWRGGTAATVRYAQKRGIRTIILHPDTLHVNRFVAGQSEKSFCTLENTSPFGISLRTK